mgnify:FL=1
MSRNRKKGFLASYKLLPCIFIIASLHHIICGIVIIHLTLANSQGEVCDEAEAIYYTFGPGKAQKMGGQWMQGKRVATQNIFKLRLLTININYSIIQKILQAELMNLQVLELSLATLGVELHILVWSYWEDEVGHGDATAIYEELYR